MKSKGQIFFKTLMSIILTALITFMITTIIMYKNFDDGKTGFVLTSNSSSLEERLKYYKQFIDKNYIYDTDEDKMEDYAVKGYFEGLGDKYSEYITKEEMDDYMADATGKYVGIGVYIANQSKTNQIIIVSPIKGSPAEEVGLKAGDIILKVDGIEYKGEQLSEASDKLKGEEGTKVKVEILRDENQILEFDVERKTIKINHVEGKILKDNIGYIQITSFDDGTYKEFKEIYNGLKDKNIKSLIIDMRNNGGGIVKEALDIADMFIEKDKTLLITKSKSVEEEITKASNDKEIDLPLVILVNENTASASEILTAALKENINTTKVVGTNTYGKGVIQSIFTLSDGSGIKLTTEEYFSPNHNTINKVGIKPDYEIELEENDGILSTEEKDDKQLQKAIDLLK